MGAMRSEVTVRAMRPFRALWSVRAVGSVRTEKALGAVRAMAAVMDIGAWSALRAVRANGGSVRIQRGYGISVRALTGQE